MSEPTWKPEFLVEPPRLTGQEKALTALATEYHERTERFDRQVCTGPIRDGAIMPANGREAALINKNALTVLAELQQRAEAIGVSARDLQRAIHDWRKVK